MTQQSERANETKKQYLDDTTLSVLFYGALLALQFGLQPMITTRCTPPGVSKSSLVIAIEVFKIIIAFTTILLDSPKERVRIMSKFTIQNSLKTAALPAALYSLQNVLIQLGYTLVDSMTFNLLNQTKTLSAAFWTYILLNKRQSLTQIFALLLLLVSALLLTRADSTTTSSATSSSTDAATFQLGILVVGAASLLSGLNGALCQVALVDPDNHKSPIIMSAELAFYGITCLIGGMIYQGELIMPWNGGDSLGVQVWSLFAKWDAWVFIPVLTSAFGGIVVGQLTKIAGSVTKGFALISGIIITGIVQWIIENKPLTVLDFVAIGLVSISIYLHSKYPVKDDKPKAKTS